MNQFNSPSAIKSQFQQIGAKKPSRFKDLTGEQDDERVVQEEGKQ
jgi:hypothetical protein